jgi:hypothetical protein
LPRLATTPHKPADALRRRNRPEDWTVLPAAGCSKPVPKWPSSKASSAETALWKRLWKLPVVAWWHEQKIEPTIVASYVRLASAKPEHASVLKLMTELGLTPAAMLRLRLVVEQPEPESKPSVDPYRHLRVAVG